MRRRIILPLGCVLLISWSVPISRACTSFLLPAPDGPVFAANLDLNTGRGHVFVNRRGMVKEGYRASTAGETAHWVSAYGSVTFNIVGRELPWAGMNEAGLVVSTMQLNASRCPDPDERPPLGEASLVQYLLDNCAEVEEAVAAAAGVRLFQSECSSHYLLADEAGACAAIEFLNGEFVVSTGDEMPVKALANAPYAAGIAFIDRGVVPLDNPGASVERVAAAAASVAAYAPGADGSAIDYSLEVLTETVAAPKKWWCDLFGEPYTRWNVVFDIARREIHFRTVDHAATRRLSLRNFALSCESPLLMLDVNAKLAGNVEESFTPYDHETNLKTFRQNCAKLGIEVSRENALALVGLFESFDCAR